MRHNQGEEPPDFSKSSDEDMKMVFDVAVKLGVQMYGGFLTAIYAGVLAERERADKP